MRGGEGGAYQHQQKDDVRQHVYIVRPRRSVVIPFELGASTPAATSLPARIAAGSDTATATATSHECC
jgi:hypothetical protein